MVLAKKTKLIFIDLNFFYFYDEKLIDKYSRRTFKIVESIKMKGNLLNIIIPNGYYLNFTVSCSDRILLYNFT